MGRPTILSISSAWNCPLKFIPILLMARLHTTNFTLVDMVVFTSLRALLRVSCEAMKATVSST